MKLLQAPPSSVTAIGTAIETPDVVRPRISEAGLACGHRAPLAPASCPFVGRR